MLISNHNSFRVLFDEIASAFFWKIYSYFSIGNGQPSEPALCQLYRRTFVPYRVYCTRLFCVHRRPWGCGLAGAGLRWNSPTSESWFLAPRRVSQSRRSSEHTSISSKHLTVESYTVFIRQQSYTYYLIIWYSITHSLFHPRLKTILFCKPFPLQPFLSSS